MAKKSSTTRRRRLVAPSVFFPTWDVGSLAGFKSVRDELVRRKVPPDLITALADGLDPGPIGGELGQQIRDLEVQLRALREAHARGEPLAFDLQDRLRRIRRAIRNETMKQLPRAVIGMIERGARLKGNHRADYLVAALRELDDRFDGLAPAADFGAVLKKAVKSWSNWVTDSKSSRRKPRLKPDGTRRTRVTSKERWEEVLGVLVQLGAPPVGGSGADAVRQRTWTIDGLKKTYKRMEKAKLRIRLGDAYYEHDLKTWIETLDTMTPRRRGRPGRRDSQRSADTWRVSIPPVVGEAWKGERKVVRWRGS